MKAFFAKIWAWVLAHKLIAGIIAGATVVVLTVAIAVPCGVSASRKKKAAQEETQQTQPAGDQGGGDQGGQQGGGSGAHTHTLDTHGFCTAGDGHYGGVTIDDISQHWNIGTSETGKAYYGRIKLEESKSYMPSCQPMDPKLDNANTHVWWKLASEWSEVNLNELNPEHPIVYNTSSADGYLYFHLEFAQGQENVQFWVEEPHVHNYGTMGLCENCPYMEYGPAYRGTTINAIPFNDEIQHDGVTYFEARFMYTPGSVYFFESQVAKSGENLKLQVAYRKGNAWEYIINQNTGHASEIIGELEGITSSFIYVKWSWTVLDDTFTSNTVRITNLANNMYFDCNDVYRGMLISDLGEANRQQIQSSFVRTGTESETTYQYIYFGYDDVHTGDRILQTTEGLTANITAYQINPANHYPNPLTWYGSYFEAKWDGAVGFVAKTTTLTDLTNNDSIKVGVLKLDGSHAPDQAGFCTYHREVYLGDPNSWEDGDGLSGAHLLANTHYFYRVNLDPHQHFHFTKNAYIEWNEVHVYYRTSLGNYFELDPTGSDVDFFDTTFDHYLYVDVCSPQETNNVTLTVHFDEHSTSEHGYCDDHDSLLWGGYALDIEPSFNNETPTQYAISCEAGETLYLRIKSTGISVGDVFDFNLQAPYNTSSDMLYAYNAESGEFVEQEGTYQFTYEITSTTDACSSYDNGNSYYYLAIQFTSAYNGVFKCWINAD